MKNNVIKPYVIVVTFIFVVLAALYFIWTASNDLAEFGGDNAYYLLIARYFSPYSPPSPVAEFFFKNSFYPPVFPLLLAFTGGGENIFVAHFVTTICLIGAFLVLYGWLSSMKTGPGLAIVVTLLFALLPGTYMQALSVHSENLYLLFSLGALLAASLSERPEGVRWLYGSAICVALASLTRGAGLSLIIAFLLYLAIRRPKAGWWLGVTAALPAVLWKIFSAQQKASYFAAFTDKFTGLDLTEAFKRYAAGQFEALWYGWYSNFTDSHVGMIVMAIIAVACLAGMILRLLQARLDGLYAGAYLALVLVWPFPAEIQRLLFVIVPVLLVQGLLLLSRVPQITLNRRRIHSGYLMMLAIALVAIPQFLLTVNRFLRPLPNELSTFRHAVSWYAFDPAEARSNIIFDKLLAEHIKSLRMLVSKNDCIYSIKPSLIGYYAGRISMIPPRTNFDTVAFNAYLKKTGCRYFYLMGFLSPSYPVVYYPLARLGDRLVIVSATRNPGRPVGILARLKDK